MATIPDSEPVTLILSADAAVVLDACLARFDQGEAQDESIAIRDPAERAAVWELQAALERNLVTPFDPSYDRIVTEASARLRAKSGL